MTTKERARRERARYKAKCQATATAHDRVLRLNDRFPYLTDEELAAFENDFRLSYLAGFTLAANDPDAQGRGLMTRGTPGSTSRTRE